MIIPVILAGGSGTRLWPLSRQLFPKQLLNLADEKRSLLQQTILRIDNAGGISEPLVICNESHRYIISEQLADLGIRPNALILEPVGRNTAPAVAVAALHAKTANPDAAILVLPADHLITDTEKFHEALRTAIRYADRSNLVTFGVIPQFPETGYGYIRKGEPVHSGGPDSDPDAYTIGEFVEKPDLETARRYVDSGQYCWNSGMFLFRAADILEELGRFAPDILESCRRALKFGSFKGDALLLDFEAFSCCRSDSVDYAVMEKTGRGVMVPFDAGWNDIGSWTALWELGEKDGAGNFVRGDVIGLENRNSLIFSQSRLVAVIGLDDAVVVESPDAVLVASRDRCQQVRSVVEELMANGRREARSHSKTYYPWGIVETLREDEEMAARRVTVSGGASLFIEAPAGRVINWVVISGRADLIKGENNSSAGKCEILRIEPGEKVEIRNSGGDNLVATEVYSRSGNRGDHFV